jgi:hypothetical protein
MRPPGVQPAGSAGERLPEDRRGRTGEPALSWLHALRRTDRETLLQASQAITALAEEGPALGRPLVDTIAFTDVEKEQIAQGAQAMITASRVHRLGELRKRQHTTQVQVAKAMGVGQARVSRIEKGQLERSEVDTLAAYVKALGGKPKIVADFGDETYVLG